MSRRSGRVLCLPGCERPQPGLMGERTHREPLQGQAGLEAMADVVGDVAAQIRGSARHGLVVGDATAVNPPPERVALDQAEIVPNCEASLGEYNKIS